MSSNNVGFHTCRMLSTKICEIRQSFKGDLTKFCETFLNITFELPQYSLNVFFFFFSCKKLVKTQRCVIYFYFFIKSVVKWSVNSVRFEFFYGNCLPDEPNSVRFYLTVFDMVCMMFFWRKLEKIIPELSPTPLVCFCSSF